VSNCRSSKLSIYYTIYTFGSIIKAVGHEQTSGLATNGVIGSLTDLDLVLQKDIEVEV
jgi:hypothetical protein